MKNTEITFTSSQLEEINNIGLKILFRDLNLKLKRELNDEEKSKIINDTSFEQYRKKATEFYINKQKSLDNKQYPVIVIPNSGEKTWIGGAYCIFFVYSKYNGNFVVKGYSNEVKDYLKNNYTHYFYNMTLWCDGFHRSIWYFWKKNQYYFYFPTNRDKRKGKKIELRQYTRGAEDQKPFSKSFKRIPKQWIKEFDNL